MGARRRGGERKGGRRPETHRWVYQGLTCVKVELEMDGPVVTVYRLRDAVDPVERERIADWLKEWLPGKTNDERYGLLWED